MKTNRFLWLLAIVIFLTGCSEDDSKTGLLEFKTLNPVASSQKSSDILKSVSENPALTGDTTNTLLTSLKFGIGDVWVSEGEVIVGQPDDLEWIRLTTETNYELKLFEDYQFSAIEIPAGIYNSIKITFRNIWYRHVELISDRSVKYELLETMGSSFDPCDPEDESWAKTNYFSTGGNHFLNDDNVFALASEGEKIAGFEVKEGARAIVSWRLGAGATEPCINYLIDENKNRVWDCGVDYIEDECPPDMEYMWDFVVEYEDVEK
jgi:hypothetical protein